MKKLSILLILGLFLIPSFFQTNSANAAVSNWQKGFTMTPRWNTDYSSASFQESIRNLKSTGANYVTLHIPLYQSNIYSTDVQTGGNTPTDQSLIDGINYAHSQGLSVMIKIQDLPYDGQWSANINPGDRTSWFTNYGNQVRHFAQLAQNTGAEEFCLGTELISMTARDANSSNTQNWNNLIGSVRGIFSGKLTYSANWGAPGTWADEKNRIDFWNNLDYIGIAAYYELYGDNSVTNLKSQWDNWRRNDIEPLHAKWGKPILFTEIGYRSYTNAHNYPWNWWTGGPYDAQDQVNSYQALFSYWNDYSWMAGAQLWDWSTDPNAGWPGNIDYTPQHKPAQDALPGLFGMGDGTSGGSGGGGTSGGGTSTPGNFNSSATMTGTGVAGQPITFDIAVSNSGGASSGNNVDIEIYDSSGNQAFQKIFGNQSFATGGSQSYSANWTPSTNGSFVLKLGVFNSNWTQLYYWNNELKSFAVGTSTGGGGTGGGGTGGGGTSTSSSLDVWWPGDGTTISGAQPFKAMLTNRDISTYSMIWRVDNGQANQMGDSLTDYPHKESLVDVSSWNWNGAGLYKLDFIAQANGTDIGSRTINIYIAH